MTHTNRAVQVGGTWFAIASLLMIAALGLHGPIAPDLHDQMMKIAHAATWWSVVHWIAATALSLFTVSGLIVLSSRSHLTEGWWTMTAWAIIPVGAFWTVTTAVTETTVAANAAVSGNSEVFEAWWDFGEGTANGYAIFALAVAIIAGREGRNPEGATPTWAAWIAVLAGVGSFAGWALGAWFGVGIGNLLWVVSSIAMSIWTLWFGIALVRSCERDETIQ